MFLMQIRQSVDCLIIVGSHKSNINALHSNLCALAF